MKTRRGQSTEQAYRALKHHGPMSDAQLAWWFGLLGLRPTAARAARERLAKAGRARCRKTARNTRGQYVGLWEAV